MWSMWIYERRNTMKEKWGYQTVAISIWGLAWKIITITLKQENLGTSINNREQYVRLNDFNAKYPRLLSIMYVISYLPRFHGFFFYILLHTPAGNIEILWIVTGLTTCSLFLRAQDCMFIWHPLALCCVLFSSWCFCKRAFQRCSSNHLKALYNNNNMLLLARLFISNCVKWLCKWKRWIRMHLFWRKN